MPLPKTFSEIQTDAQGCEFVIHKPSGVRYYINRRVDPKLNGTAGFRSTPWTTDALGGVPAPRVADVVSAGEPLPARHAVVPAPARNRPIYARFIKGPTNEYF